MIEAGPSYAGSRSKFAENCFGWSRLRLGQQLARHLDVHLRLVIFGQVRQLTPERVGELLGNEPAPLRSRSIPLC